MAKLVRQPFTPGGKFIAAKNFKCNGKKYVRGEEFPWRTICCSVRKLRQLYEQALGTVDREQQQRLIRQMERHTSEQASFLFLYNPIQLYAVNKDVKFIPSVNRLDFTGISVTDQHWSVREETGGQK